MSGGDRSALHQPGDVPHRCGPCRKGNCDRCIPIRCTCTHDNVSAAARTPLAIAPPPAPRRAELAEVDESKTIGDRILAELARGAAVAENGRATGVLAERVGIRSGGNAFSTRVGQLEKQGLLRREASARRTYRIELTDAGLARVEGVPLPKAEDPAPDADSAGMRDLVRRLLSQAVEPFAPDGAGDDWWSRLYDHFGFGDAA